MIQKGDRHSAQMLTERPEARASALLAFECRTLERREESE